jgi:small neutral amino acid transporter SnatA (MarC family)
VSFGLMVAGFLATANAGRVALAAQALRPGRRERVAAPLVGAALVLAGVLCADPLLDALAISPESMRIAAGIVIGVAALRTMVRPDPGVGPFAAVLFTPELAIAALSFGADEPAGRVLLAAVPALVLVPLAYRLPQGALAARFLAALAIVVAVALIVAGIRDV